MTTAMLYIQKHTGSAGEEEKLIHYDYQIESNPVIWKEDNVQDNYTCISELAR